MAERRPSLLLLMGVALVAAVLWDLVSKTRHEAAARSTAAVPDSAVATRPPPRSPGPSAGAVAPASSAGTGNANVLEQLGRAETRRRVRGSASETYLDEMLAASSDSMLRRWDNRGFNPVRVYLSRGTVAHFQPGFLDAVRAAFRRWEETRVPVRFNLDSDSATAEVRVAWREKFDIDRTGQTDLTWNASGHLLSGVLTIATVDPNSRPMGGDDVRVVMLHEIGHLIGLDHSPDSGDIMFPIARVRELSARDIETARLLYQLPAGSIR